MMTATLGQFHDGPPVVLVDLRGWDDEELAVLMDGVPEPVAGTEVSRSYIEKGAIETAFIVFGGIYLSGWIQALASDHYEWVKAQLRRAWERRQERNPVQFMKVHLNGIYRTVNFSAASNSATAHGIEEAALAWSDVSTLIDEQLDLEPATRFVGLIYHDGEPRWTIQRAEDNQHRPVRIFGRS